DNAGKRRQPALPTRRSSDLRTPTSESSVPAAKLKSGARNPGNTSETTPASTHPTATLSSQNPGASISATNKSSAVTSQTCHSCKIGRAHSELQSPYDLVCRL